MNDKLEEIRKGADVTYFKGKDLGGMYMQAAVAYLGSICLGQAEGNYVKSVRIAGTLDRR
jgi:hypothetical protein